MKAPKKIERVVIFGGGGLVGYQIARLIAKDIIPQKIVLCALFEEEAATAAENLKKEFPHIKEIEIEYGNIFVREALAHAGRNDITDSKENLNTIYNDVFGKITDDTDNVGQQNLMCQIIMKHRPDIVVDCVNTATGISYQDVKSSSQVVKEFRDNLDDIIAGKSGQDIKGLANSPLESFPHLDNLRMIDTLLVSQSIPQLVRHVILLHRAMTAAGTSSYVKVGTTGTGGMGVNIPYTHGEDKPSFTLMTKSAVGFAHTGLLFLLARTPGPSIKEIKPGAMIGYRKVDYRAIKKHRAPVKRKEPIRETLSTELHLRKDANDFKENGDLQLVGIDTGENGFFTRAEFEAITYLNQMEFVTPEEIAELVLKEISGANTGKDVIGAIDSSVLNPSYRAGYIRQDAINAMEMMEDEKGVPSIAIGELGPPQLSKFLYEVHILQHFFDTVAELADESYTAEEMAERAEKYVMENDIREIITSLGLPVLLRDGKTILRGPSIAIPESKVHANVKIENASSIDEWARQGWVDLRVENMRVWKARAKKMMASQNKIYNIGSSAYGPDVYKHKKLHTGEVVGWIFINEFGGQRIK